MKGILFKPWKIKFIAEHPDMEIQTRRLGGLEEINRSPNDWEIPIKVVNEAYPLRIGDWLFQHKEQLTLIEVARPRYHGGETVYIKEACYKDNLGDWRYGLDDALLPMTVNYTNRTSINPLFLPEMLARHFILIEAVRAERLQEINPNNELDRINFKDLCAEGWLSQVENRVLPFGSLNEQGHAMQWYRELWNSINPKYPFESNPWEFAYQFRLMIRRR